MIYFNSGADFIYLHICHPCKARKEVARLASGSEAETISLKAQQGWSLCMPPAQVDVFDVFAEEFLLELTYELD